MRPTPGTCTRAPSTRWSCSRAAASIQVGEVEETLEPLKGIRILPGRPHRVSNDSRLLLRYFVCASPGTDPTIDRAPAEAPPRRLDA